MDKKLDKKQKRLVIAAYIVVTFIAILTLFVGLNTKDGSQSFFLGLSASSFVTVMIFLVFRFFMSNSDDLLLSKVDDLISVKLLGLKYNTSEHESLTKFFEGIENEKLTHLDMIGYSMAHIFQQHEREIRSLLSNKVKIRVIVIDPDSLAGNLMKEKVGSLHQVGEPHIRTLRYINNINNCKSNIKEKIQVSKISWIPSCTIILGKKKNEYFKLLIGINGFSIKNDIARRLYSSSTSNVEDEKVTFFKSHFDSIWEENKSRIFTDLTAYLINNE